MTREKIINEIKCLLSELNNGENAVSYLTQNDVEWLNENIKALEPKPMEKFESVKDHIFKLASDYKCWDNRLTDDEALELCHVLEQEPRKGHWIPTYGNVKCSVCGSVKDSREVGKATHYCDFCGAKMESEG